jgi:hypothetical protein
MTNDDIRNKISHLVEPREHMGNVYATCAAYIIGHERKELSYWSDISMMVRSYIIHLHFNNYIPPPNKQIMT